MIDGYFNPYTGIYSTGLGDAAEQGYAPSLNPPPPAKGEAEDAALAEPVAFRSDWREADGEAIEGILERIRSELERLEIRIGELKGMLGGE